MKYWEHKVILGHGIADKEVISWEEELNRYGKEGWELVSTIVRPEVPASEGKQEYPHGPEPRIVVFLKREIRP